MAKRLANKSRRNLIKNTEIGRRKFESNLDRIAEYQNKIQDEYETETETNHRYQIQLEQKNQAKAVSKESREEDCQRM